MMIMFIKPYSDVFARYYGIAADRFDANLIQNTPVKEF